MIAKGKQGNTRLRTRKQLLDAANRLLKNNVSPTLEEIAEEALVSRATVYRYFPNVDALLNEAGLDLSFPSAETILAGAPDDPAERLVLIDHAVDTMIDANEPSLRHMLIHSLKLSLAGSAEPGVKRQNRRLPLIEAALLPVMDDLPTETAKRLVSTLALFIGTESMLVFKDVLGMDRTAAAETKDWAIRALVAAALQDTQAVKSTGPN